MLNRFTTQGYVTQSAKSANRSRVLLIVSLLFIDTVFAVLFSTVSVAITPSLAYAYVDPSVMTYTIQALAGVAVALSAVLGVAFRRTRKMIMRVFHIDADAGKISERSVSRIEGEEANAELASADEYANEVRERLAVLDAPKQPKQIVRFLKSLLVCAFLFFTIFVVAPLEIVGQSTSGLLFGFFDIFTIVLVVAVISVVIVSVILSFIKGRAFDIVMSVLAGIGICCYIQSLFMNSALPVADGTTLDLSNHVGISILSTVVWVVVIAAMVLFASKFVKPERAFTSVICIGLIIVQIAGVVGVATSRNVRDNYHDDGAIATRQGLYSLSENENIVEFVLDTYDIRYLNAALEEDPNALDEFTGFTAFMNSTPKMVPTRYAVPYLLSGKTLKPGDDFREFESHWYDENYMMDQAVENGFNVNVYTDSLGSNITKVEPYASNVHLGKIPINIPKMIFELDKMALYRDMPWLLKPLFWFTTDDLNSALSQTGELDTLPYTIDDARFAEDLREVQLSLNDNEKEFKFIHMLGPHRPFLIDENGNSSSDSTLERQARGSIRIVSEYLAQMKELGIYDDSLIIVTADHGNWQNAPSGVDEPTSAIILVKPPQNSEEASEPIKFSFVPASHDDLVATVAYALGVPEGSMGPTVFDVTDEPRDRYYWNTTTDYHDDIDFEEWVISGDVLDWESWEKTGNTIQINPPDINQH